MNIEIPIDRERNLISYPFDEAKGFNKSYCENGLIFIDNGDGSVTVNGTSKGLVFYRINVKKPIKIKAKTDYYVSGCPDGKCAYQLDYCIREIPEYGPSFVGCDNGKGCRINHFEDGYICEFLILIRENVTLDMVTFKPQIEEGNEPTSFEPVKWKTIKI